MDAQPSGTIIIPLGDAFQRQEGAADVESDRRGEELMRQWEAARVELGEAQRAVNALLRQRDSLVQRARQEAKEEKRRQREAEQEEAQARARPSLWKRLGIKA